MNLRCWVLNVSIITSSDLISTGKPYEINVIIHCYVAQRSALSISADRLYTWLVKTNITRRRGDDVLGGGWGVVERGRVTRLAHHIICYSVLMF